LTTNPPATTLADVGHAETDGLGPGFESADIGVFLVDDHEMVRRGLRGFLDGVDGVTVIGEAVDGRAALDDLARRSTLGEPLPQVVLMDLMMPRLGGIDAIAAVRAAYPQIQVVALTSFTDAQRVRAALDAGAAGYVLKDADVDEVATAVRAAAREEVHLDAKIARTLARTVVGVGTPADLTVREREVLTLVAAGRSNRDIADALVIGERTARTHVSHVIMKLGLESRIQAALWALRNGMATIDPVD
jgi:DNA-binding NarL/FixJ family response regulator